jgi:hypothetical protein
MEVVAIDFETFYHKKRKISLSEMVAERYLEHPEVTSDIYLSALVGDGWSYCEDPHGAPWERINGAIWLSHNWRFDYSVLKHLQRTGVIPSHITPSACYCTCDMSRYLWSVGSLKDAVKVATGRDISKAYRHTADGKTGAELRANPEHWKEVTDACLSDATECRNLFLEFGHLWPEFERRISQFNREGQMRGVYIDRELAEKNMALCRQIMAEAESRIPWYDEWKASDLKTITAKRFIRAQCERDGVTMPLTMNKKDASFIQWKARNLERLPWLQALEDWQEAGRLLDLHETTLSWTGADGMMPFNLIYRGATSTGRFSGGGRDE